MKQITHINLGGHPVTIDVDAFELLSRYLDSLEAHFADSPGKDEIMSDIETRLAELFKEHIHPRTIVSLPDVKAAIDIMGTPDMFGAETFFDRDEAPKSDLHTHAGPRPGRKLFRDPDNKVIAGVCSGLAAYFGLQDPIWIRLLFVVTTLIGMASIPVYILLWIIMPVPKTAADKLAMRGEPVNVQKIADTIISQIESLSEKIDQTFSNKKEDNFHP